MSKEVKEVKVPKEVKDRSVSLELPDELWWAVKACAGSTRTTVKAWVAASLRASVARHERAGVVALEGKEIPAGAYRPGQTFELKDPKPMPDLPPPGAPGGSPIERIFPQLQEPKTSLPDGAQVVQTPPTIGRDPEARCRRCDVPWRLHQSGQFKNRAVLTGCTTWTEGI